MMSPDGSVLFQDQVLCQLWRLYLQRSGQAYTSNPVRSSKFKLVSSQSLSVHFLLVFSQLHKNTSGLFDC